MNVYLPFTARLPSAYQEVEYIQSTGTQYIDTGVYGTGNTKIEAGFVVTGRYGNYDMYYGAYGPDGGKYCMFLQSNYPDNNKIRACNYSNRAQERIYVDSTSDIAFNTMYNITHTNTSLVINGVSQGTMSSSTFTTDYTMYIFCVHSPSGQSGARGLMKLYTFKIYSGNTLQRDFVPCYRKSDSVIGLYDLVNNQFYTNSGSGTFSKGNDVTMSELKNAYIGEVWTPGSNTLLYIPLDSTNTKNDIYGGNTTTQLGTVRYGTYGGVDCADFTTGGCIYSNMLNGVSTYTVLIWANNINGNSASDGYGGNVFAALKSGVSNHPGIYYGNSSSSNGYFTFYANNSSGDIYFNTNTKSHWFLFAICISSSTKKAYLFGDGSYKELDISSSTTNSQYAQIGSVLNINNLAERTDRRFYGYLSNLIIENKLRTAQEISHYYDITKYKYGL